MRNLNLADSITFSILKAVTNAVKWLDAIVQDDLKIVFGDSPEKKFKPDAKRKRGRPFGSKNKKIKSKVNLKRKSKS